MTSGRKVNTPEADRAIFLSFRRISARIERMKSAYELAMGRLEKSAPTARLTDAQKRAIAEVDSEINAKIAEKKIFLEGQLAGAEPSAKDEIRRQLVSELARLEEKREREKEKIRSR
jgi:hypothetical protein